MRGSGDLEKDRCQAGDEDELESGCTSKVEAEFSDEVSMGQEGKRVKESIQVLVLTD